VVASTMRMQVPPWLRRARKAVPVPLLEAVASPGRSFTKLCSLGFRLQVTCLVGLAFVCGCASTASGRPRVYFYPPPFHLGDQVTARSPVTVSSEQATSLVPLIPEMDGVVVILYWAQLCPEDGQCNFKIVDDILSYWRGRGKKIVLSIATVGFPMNTLLGGKVVTIEATPNWLLGRICTYSEPVRLIGNASQLEKVETPLPCYNDPRFVAAVQAFVTQLSRYDGDTAVSQIRISTGLLGEDNPSPDGYRSKMTGFTPEGWIRYCRIMLQTYAAVFHKTELEFDIGWISWFSVLGGPLGAQEAEQFVSELASHRVMLSFNGLESSTLADLLPNSTGPGRSLHFLQGSRSRGLDIGLEDSGPLVAPKMRDVDAITRVLAIIQPSRLVLFGTDAVAIEQFRNKAKALASPGSVLTDRDADVARKAERLINSLDASQTGALPAAQ
jgi:hypothetical protein